MKNLSIAGLAAVLLLAPAAAALAEDQVVSVTFESVAAQQTKSGESLDPALFHFGKGAGGHEDYSRVSSSAWHKDKQDACRWALLGGFIKFQHKAKASGQHIAGIRTYAGTQESSKRDECICLAGGAVVRSVIKASYK
jgi:hypothetical protein